jgi:hypothetical protein
MFFVSHSLMIGGGGGNNWVGENKQTTEHVFTILFAIELSIHLVTCGVAGPSSFFTDGWNWVEALVVIFGYISPTNVP